MSTNKIQAEETEQVNQSIEMVNQLEKLTRNDPTDEETNKQFSVTEQNIAATRNMLAHTSNQGISDKSVIGISEEA